MADYGSEQFGSEFEVASLEMQIAALQDRVAELSDNKCAAIEPNLRLCLGWP